MACSVPRIGGIKVGNIRSENLGEWDRLISKYVDPLAAPLLENLFVHVVNFTNSTGSRFFIPDVGNSSVVTIPPTALLVCMIIIAVGLLVGTVTLSVWRYGRTTVTNHDGVPISLKRVLVEDTVLMLLVILTAFGFAWSNSTTAATLVIGDDLHLMSFSLLETSKKMYN
ncbi:hypothetical protein DQ04_06361000, partial [Trypanosoma grayi]|uniref:hypothetical protein n=1 Tax=Trypanosoma grayi TaxID=71804 RepID=UPI0004F43578